MLVHYDLNRRIAGFDFFNWLVLAKARGATGVVIDARRPKTDKWPLDVVLKRVESIIRPGVALAGLPIVEAEGGLDIADPHMREIVAWCQAGRPIQRLRSVLPAGDARYTVTLRATQRTPGRNSNEDAWRTFAEEIGAVLIEDYDVQPIGLHERVALYAGARMNFFVTNGPMHLCSLTEYPMVCFNCDRSGATYERLGIPFGGQYPWNLPHQRLVWEADELPNLRRVFREWQASSPS